MEPGPERLARIAELTGATEKEALVLFHLEQAGKAWSELPSAPSEGNKTLDKTRATILFLAPHQSLIDMVLARINRREHLEAFPPLRPDAGSSG